MFKSPCKRMGAGFCSLLMAVVFLPMSTSWADSPSPEDAPGEWVSLFNGKNLKGWKQINGTATYEVDNGTVLGTTVEKSPNSFLCTKKHYGNYWLEFEVKLEDDELNSGVQIRSNSTEEYRKGRVHGYQVEISTNGNAGFIYDEARRGWLSTEEARANEVARGAFKPSEWNHYRVYCNGDEIKTWINGIPVADLSDDMTAEGFIGLQVHGVKGDPHWQVRWRNIRIKELQ
ncbi:Secreted glycosyl hydrolase [Planctomycetales bacterium 10988]|nr:Secreted glycosyl hydrolase [Planctomycetales bacterium 10988]